jgi:hypothetical protein
LNHPRFPLKINGGLKATNSEETKPAVVFHNILTNAKTMITVSDPQITGRTTVKSSSEIPLLPVPIKAL